MLAALITQLQISVSTKDSRRNIQDLFLPTDLTAATSIHNTSHTLRQYVLNDARCEIEVLDIKAFLHVVANKPVTVELTMGADTVSFVMEKHFTLTSEITGIKITSIDTEESTDIKLIYA